MRRRAMLGLAAAAWAAPAAALLPERVRLIAPGPAEGPLALLAARLAEGLPPLLPSALSLAVVLAGGPDGVAAALRFAADPLDPALLLLPGRAAAARLAGDPRARFDPAGWGVLLLRARPLVLAGRGEGLPPAVRVAIDSPASAEALAVALLDQAGVAAEAVPGLGPEAAERAFAAGQVGALLATPERAAALGAVPWFGLPVPGLPEIGPPVPGAEEPFAAACRAAAAALRVEAALVAPSLTSADALAAWRWAAGRLAERESGLIAGPEALAAFAALWPSAEAEAAWRGWLARRFPAGR